MATSIIVIEHTTNEFDNRADAAAYLLGNTNTPEVQPAPVENSTPAPQPVDILGAILGDLTDPRFTLRDEQKLVDKYAFLDVDHFEDYLAERNVDFVIKTKRGSGARLIGLASRN